MLRSRLKYIVPVCALALTAALLLDGYFEERKREQVWGPISSWDGPPPRGIELAMALNAPAVVPASAGLIAIALTTHVLERESIPWWVEVPLAVYFCALVLAQWIFIGWLLGRDRKVPSASPDRSLGLRLFLNALGIVVSLGFLSFGIYDMKTSGWMSTWIPGAGIAAWSLAAAAAFAFRLRRTLVSRGA